MLPSSTIQAADNIGQNSLQIPSAMPEQGGYEATCLGGPTVILDIGGMRFMTDPTLDPAGGVYPVVADLVVTKLTGPATTDIGVIDVVLLSHDQHNDNLDKKGRELLKEVKTVITNKLGSAEDSLARVRAASSSPSQSGTTRMETPQSISCTKLPALP